MKQQLAIKTILENESTSSRENQPSLEHSYVAKKKKKKIWSKLTSEKYPFEILRAICH